MKIKTKHHMRYFLNGLTLLLFASNAHALDYSPEINTIRARTQGYFQYGDSRWQTLNQYVRTWESIDFYLEELAVNASAHFPDEATADSSDESTDLTALAREKVYVENLLAKLNEYRPLIEAKLLESGKLTDDFKDLKLIEEKAHSQITSDLNTLEGELTQRSNAVDQELAQRIETQREMKAQQISQSREALLEELKRMSEIAEAGETFNVLKFQIYQAFIRKDYIKAKGLLDGFVWYRSTFSLYFSQQILSSEQQEQVKKYEEYAANSQQEIIATLNHSRPTLAIAATLHAGLKYRSGALGMLEGGMERPERGDAESDWDHERDRASDMPAGSERHESYREDFLTPDGQRGTAERSVDIDKSVCEYNQETGQGQIDVKISGDDLVHFDAKGNADFAVTSPVGPELQRNLDLDLRNDIKEHFETVYHEPCNLSLGPSETPGKIEQSTRDLERLVHTAGVNSKSRNDREGLAVLESEIKYYEQIQSTFKTMIDQALRQAFKFSQQALGRIEKIKSSKKPKPTRPPKAQKSSQAAREQASEMSKKLADFMRHPHNTDLMGGMNQFIRSFLTDDDHPLNSGAQQAMKVLNRNTPKPHSNAPHFAMTSEMRNQILNQSEKLTHGKIRYSKAHRSGPDSFDCSGFVWEMYRQAGLTYGEGHPILVAEIPDDPNFELIDASDAQPGDLVVHTGDDGNHVGILSGFDQDGTPLEISAQTRKDHAKRSIDHKKFLNSITASPVTFFPGLWRIYRWKN